MDALANYDSEEEDDCKTEQKFTNMEKTEAASIVKIVEFNSKASSLNSRSIEKSRTTSNKKRRKLDLSFLPSEIVNALTRGDSTKDSDDEVEIGQNGKPTKSEPSSISQCKLLSLLPPPATSTKQPDFNRIVDSDVSIPKLEKSGAHSESKSNVISRPKPNFNFQYTVQETQKSISSLTESKPKFNESQGYSLNQSSSTHFNPKSSLICNPLYSVEEENDSFQIQTSNSVKNSSLVRPFPAQISSMLASSSSSSSSSNSNSSAIGQAATKSNRKKRDRELEQQLLSGNLAALPDDAPTLEMNANRQWDAAKYTDQQQREAMIFKEFGVSQQKNLAQPTRQQNRKHQLSSLAIKAAQVELSMLDARGNRMKTKSETQGKYGW